MLFLRKAVFAAFYQAAVYPRIRNYSKTLRVCRSLQTLRTTWNDISAWQLKDLSRQPTRLPTQTNPQFAPTSSRGDRTDAHVGTLMHTIACVQSCVWCALEADRWILVRQVPATKWSLSGYGRTWLPPDSARIRKVSRSNETKLIQNHYRELTAFRAVTAYQDLLSSVYDSRTIRR